MTRRMIHSHESSLFDRTHEDDSVFFSAGVGAVAAIIMVLATLWLFAGAETVQPPEPACPPVETDLIVENGDSVIHTQVYVVKAIKFA